MYVDEVYTVIANKIKVQAHCGFRGIQKYHKNIEIQKRKSKNKPLTKSTKI